MFCLSAILVFSQGVKPDLDRYIYPLAPAQPAPEITVDSTVAPDLKEWGDKAKDLATTWFPHLCELLATKDWKAPKQLKFTFRDNQSAPAYTAGREISFSTAWVRKHPEDLGMVIHELTHVVQSYPRNANRGTGWLTEGIADYTRWWRYEPEVPRSRIDFSKATYHDAYRTTAYWLAWVSQKYDRRLVPALDAEMRAGHDPMPIFAKVTGKSPDDLWTEFRAAIEPKQKS